MLERTGFDKVMFTTDITNETRENGKKGKLSTKAGSLILETPMESKVPSSYPVINENGEPVFVIIQFKLHEPLERSRTTEELTQELDGLLGPREDLSPYPYTGDLPEEQYIDCIRKLVETITEIYRVLDLQFVESPFQVSIDSLIHYSLGV